MKNLFVFLLLAGTCFGQGSVRSDSAFRSTAGAPGAVIRVCTSAATGSTCSPLASVYSDSALQVPINQTTNPITADSNGNYTYYAACGTYKEQSTYLGATSTQVVSVPCVSDVASSWSAAQTFETVNNVQYVTANTTGADLCAKIATAMGLLPSTGGAVDARGLQGAQTCASDPFTGSTKKVVVTLGAATVAVSAQILPKSGQHLRCEGSGDYSSTAFYSACVLKPVAGFTPASVIKLDPANIDASAAFVQGVSLENITIDMTNIAADSKIAFEFRSVSNTGPFRNLTVLNQDSGQYLYIGRSANAGAGPSDGFTIYDSYFLGKTAGRTSTDPAVIIEDANEITFAGARTKIQGRSGATPGAGTVGVVVRSTATGRTNAITFDGIAVAEFETHVLVQTGAAATLAPLWTRFLNCTFEDYNIAIRLLGGAPADTLMNWVGPGNRFISSFGASPVNVAMDRAARSTVWLDDDSNTSTTLATMSANASSNFVIARGDLVTDAGTNNVVIGHQNAGQGFQLFNGKLLYGTDTTIRRIGAGQVELSGGGASWLRILHSNTTDATIFDSLVSGEANARFKIWKSGKHEWGAGGASAVDTNLYRRTTGVLTTDTAFEATGGLKAGASGSNITDTRAIVQATYACGATATCANTALGSERIVHGTVPLATASPSTVTVTGISPAFTSTSSFHCTASPVGTTAAIAAGGVAVNNVSTSSVQFTGPNTVTTVISFICIGS